MLHHVLLATSTLLVLGSCQAALIQPDLSQSELTTADQRFLVTNGSSLSVGINSLYAAVLAVLGGLALLAALFFLLSLLLGEDEESGYSYSSGSAYARARSAYVEEWKTVDSTNLSLFFHLTEAQCLDNYTRTKVVKHLLTTHKHNNIISESYYNFFHLFDNFFNTTSLTPFPNQSCLISHESV